MRIGHSNRIAPNLVPRVYVTLVQRSGKRETLGKSVSEDKNLVIYGSMRMRKQLEKLGEKIFNDSIEFSLEKCLDKSDVLTLFPLFILALFFYS